MHGKVIQFKGEFSNFKVKDGMVTIQLAADTNDIVLDKLNEIATDPLMVNLEASQTELISENQESH